MESVLLLLLMVLLHTDSAAASKEETSVLIVTGFTENIRDYAVAATAAKRLWAEKHGYELVVHRGVARLFDAKEAEGRNPAWEKVLALQKQVGAADWIAVRACVSCGWMGTPNPRPFEVRADQAC